MFCSAKGCATISCRVMNCEQHETGLGEGGSRVITAGQPSLILINITTKRFAQEAGRRTGREPARPTQACVRCTASIRSDPEFQTSNFTCWAPVSHLGKRDNHPFPAGVAEEPALADTRRSGRLCRSRLDRVEPSQITHPSRASPVTLIPKTHPRPKVSKPSSKSSVITSLICKSTLQKSSLPPNQGEERSVPP